MTVESKDLAVLAQKADSGGRRLRGASRISRRKRSSRWWARKYLEQLFSTCMQYRYVLLFLVFTFVAISFKNQVILPENISAGWNPPPGVMEPAGKSASAIYAWPHTPTVTASESPAVAAPALEQVVNDTESMSVPASNVTDPWVSTPVIQAENADS